MMESPVTKKTIFFAAVLSIFTILIIIIYNYFDDRTKIVFCNVGQGDGTYIRIKNIVDVLIDAGPDKSVLACLGKYMPFWDRKIEIIFVSHNQKDHFGGLNYILDRYQINTIYIVNDLNASLQSSKRLKQKIVDKRVKIEESFAGKIILPVQPRRLDEAKFTIIWPPVGFTSSNDNDFSSVILFECCRGGSRPALTFLFTGDASPFVLGRLSHGTIDKINILKIPHHGSKNGLTKKFLDLADPEIAVISVGKNNSYGHPNQQVLDMLKAKNVKIRRTDEEGNIVFKIPNPKHQETNKSQ